VALERNLATCSPAKPMPTAPETKTLNSLNKFSFFFEKIHFLICFYFYVNLQIKKTISQIFYL
jgi:hypothetical protein